MVSTTELDSALASRELWLGERDHWTTCQAEVVRDGGRQSAGAAATGGAGKTARGGGDETVREESSVRVRGLTGERPAPSLIERPMLQAGTIQRLAR